MRAAVSTPAVLLIGSATAFAQGPAFPEVVEFEAAVFASVWTDFLPFPLSDSEQDADRDVTGPEAEALAQIVGDPFSYPSSEVEVVAEGQASGSNRITLDMVAVVDLERWPSGRTPRARRAEGEWQHSLVFDLNQPTRAEIRVLPSGFDGLDFPSFEPGRLIGPDGEIFSGQPVPGITSWTWLVTLDPGRYVFETFGEFGVTLDRSGALFENPALDISMLFFQAGCPADLDGDGELTVFDFLEFQNLFDTGDLRADFDDAGELTLFDFLAFQNAFDAGCP
ncbi:MAG: GC-type dockerin domain-anchored protein [Phycisphaerales bacterium]